MAISRMQEPRQLYGLGSLVKKAVRGVKKIVKSPLGKAALIGAAGFGIPGTGIGGLFGRASFGGAAKGLLGRYGIGATIPSLFANPSQVGPNVTKGFFPKMFGKMSTGQKIFGGLSAAAVLSPFLKKGPEEVVEEVDEDYIDPYTAMMMARNRDPYMSFLPNQNYVQEGFYLPQNAANGGRIGYANGEMVEAEQMVETEGPQLPPEAEKFLRQEYQKYVAQGGDLSYPEFKQLVLQQASGEQGPEQEEIMTSESETVQTEPQMPMMMAGGGLTSVPGYGTPSGTNRFNYPSGGVRVGRAEGGLMDLGGMEKDYRAEGGFVPIGAKEKADDVPARLSVNEFVFTADAVRNAGGGDIDKGAEVMENLMDHLESGGQVSDESQGLEGAQKMYNQQQMLQSRIG